MTQLGTNAVRAILMLSKLRRAVGQATAMLVIWHQLSGPLRAHKFNIAISPL
jgi:hypothetical protein